MNKRDKNKLRTRVLDALTPAQASEAREAWNRVLKSQPGKVVLVKHTAAPRLALLAALDQGLGIAEAETVARNELAKELEA